MGAKKKGLANKLAKMSDEERARYLQQRADIEEEARRRKQQLIATFMKNKLKKEDGFLRLNLSKINQYWHQILRKVKCKEMKEELEYMKRWIERTVSLKNRTIENLIQELEDAEEQYANNLQAHLSHIDEMLEYHRDYIKSISATYEEDRDRLLGNLEKDKEELNFKALEEETYLKTIIYGQQAHSEELGKKAQMKYDDDKIEELTSFKLSIGKLKKEREDILNAIWKQIANVLRVHVENVDKKRAHMAELKRLDAESAAEILKSQERINQEEQTLEKLKKEYETLKINTEEAFKYLTVAKEQYSDYYAKIRKQLQKDLINDEKQLLFMTDESNKSVNYLEKILNKGSQILQLIDTCRKYETEKDSLICYLPEIDLESRKTQRSSSTLSSLSLTPSSSKDESDDAQTNLNIPPGYVKYKIRRPQTSYSQRLEDRLQKVIQIAEDLQQVDVETTTTATTARSQSRKLRKLEELKDDDAELIFTIDHPFLDNYRDLKDLENLWKVSNHVELDFMEMKVVKVRLLNENKHLRGLLRSVLEAAALDKSGVSSRIPTRVCSRYKTTKSAPVQRRKA